MCSSDLIESERKEYRDAANEGAKRSQEEIEKLQADLAEAQRERLHTVGICEEEVKDVRAENERLRKALDNWAYLQTKLEAAHTASAEGE